MPFPVFWTGLETRLSHSFQIEKNIKKKFLKHYFWPRAMAHTVQKIALSNSMMFEKKRKEKEIKDEEERIKEKIMTVNNFWQIVMDYFERNHWFCNSKLKEIQ